MTVELFDTVPKQYENSIFKMLCDADKDFIPALSTRNSTTQGDFSGSADADKPYAYFETVKSQAALLCTENGKLLGFMSFVKNRILEINGKYCSAVYLSTLIVDKTARGKGISKLLYNRLLSEYADKNIITCTWSSNVAHLNLLEKMGFCLLYTIKNDRGEGIDTVYFGKMANMETEYVFKEITDFERVRNAYIELIDATPDTMWVYGKHPSDESIRGYINKHQMYALQNCKNNEIAGLVAFIPYQEGNYTEVPWKTDLKDSEVAVLHILAVTPKYRNKGLSRKLLDESFNLAKEKGLKGVRLDTLCNNYPAQHIYSSYGFDFCARLNFYTQNAGYIDFLFYEYIF